MEDGKKINPEEKVYKSENLHFNMQKESEVWINKAKLRIDLNRSLLVICFTLFTLIIAINPLILKNNTILTVELILAIPLLISSSLTRMKLVYSNKREIWNNFGFITFIIAYGLLINVIGMFLTSLVNQKISMLFFGANILMALAYSLIEVFEDKEKLSSRFYKDLFFIAVLVFGGILPCLGVY